MGMTHPSDPRHTDPHKAVDFMVATAGEYAKAKGDRIYLEHFRKSKKALLMAMCKESAVNAREQFAYAHAEYLEVLEGIRAAVEIEEALLWKLRAAQARLDVWRSQEASNRGMDRAMQ